MSPSHDAESLRALQTELETFLKTLHHPLLTENDVELLDLEGAEWRLTIEFGKLIFCGWNATRSVSRRIEDIAYRDSNRLGAFAHKPGSRESTTLEFRELESQGKILRGAERGSFQRRLLAMLAQEYPGWSFERVSSRSDREHSFSAWYTRGVARQGRTGWAFLGLSQEEAPAAADNALAYGLIWLDWLRGHAERCILPGLKLFLPPAAVSVSAHRAAYLNQRAAQLEIFEWRPDHHRPTPVDLRDFGNVETRLAPRRQGAALLERHQPLLRALLGEMLDRLQVVADPSGSFLSLRVLGLEVGRVEGQLSPRVSFGLEGEAARLEEGNREDFRAFVTRVLEERSHTNSVGSNELYRLQSERWLESLLVRDITRIDPALSPAHVYPQVPAFAGTDRGVIDILLATCAGRLAVMELKVQEHINLPLQALDYWLRVKWLHEREQFCKFGYFPGAELAPSTPLLYLVSPAFRFHSTTQTLVRYLEPAIQVIQVGLNNSWRNEPKVLFRRELRPR